MPSEEWHAEKAKEEPYLVEMRKCIKKIDQLRAEKPPKGILAKSRRKKEIAGLEHKAQMWADKANVHARRMDQIIKEDSNS